MPKDRTLQRRGLAGLVILALLVCLCFTLAIPAAAEEAQPPLLISPAPTGPEEVKTNADAVSDFIGDMGITMLIQNMDWKSAVMILLSFFLMYLAIGKGFEPLLLLPIAFGMLLTNLPGAGMFHSQIFEGGHVHWDMFRDGVPLADGSSESVGLIDILYLGVKLGIFVAYLAATSLLGFTQTEAASIGIIGGADGPTAIYTTSILAPHLLGPIAIAAYSYMALVPVIQPPIMRGLTTQKERLIRMDNLRPVSKKEKIIFPVAVTFFVSVFVRSAAPLIGCLMLGNLLRECGVTDRLAKTAQNELMNIVVIFLGISVGATAKAESFLDWATIGILVMGIAAFAGGTASGVLLAKFMNLFLPEGKKINPLIGSAGVSAVPMAARVSQKEGQREDPTNFLLMHAMGPNVAGVIGSAVAAGVLIALFG